MHTRTAYKLIPVPPLERRRVKGRTKRAQGKTEEREIGSDDGGKGRRKREGKVEKN